MTRLLRSRLQTCLVILLIGVTIVTLIPAPPPAAAQGGDCAEESLPDGRRVLHCWDGRTVTIYPTDWSDPGRAGAIDVVYPVPYEDGLGDSSLQGATVTFYSANDPDFPGQVVIYYTDGRIEIMSISAFELMRHIPGTTTGDVLGDDFRLTVLGRGLVEYLGLSVDRWGVISRCRTPEKVQRAVIGNDRSVFTGGHWAVIPSPSDPQGNGVLSITGGIFSPSQDAPPQCMFPGIPAEGSFRLPESDTALISYAPTGTAGQQQQTPAAIVLTFDAQLTGVDLSPDETLVATGTADGAVQLWDTETGDLALALVGHASNAWQVQFSPDGALLASAGHSAAEPPPPGAPNEIRLWDVATGSEIAVLTGPESVWSLAFSPDAALLAVGGGLSDIWIYDVASGAVVTEIAHNPTVTNDFVNDVAFSPDGAQLAAGSYDFLKLYDTSSWQLVSTFSDLAPVQYVIYGPDGSVLITGGDGVFISDAASGARLQTLFELGPPPEHPVLLDLDLSRDGTMLSTILATFDENWEVAEVELTYWGFLLAPSLAEGAGAQE